MYLGPKYSDLNILNEIKYKLNYFSTTKPAKYLVKN